LTASTARDAKRSLSCDDLRVRAVIWKTEPDAHDYPAAAAYLLLLAPQSQVDVLVSALKSATPIHQKAKDILRAAGLPLLPHDNAHVASDLDKIRQNKPLSPVLLVRGELSTGRALQIADGYHRICASYYIDENTDIPCYLAVLAG
jgi:hypothetical protein